MRPIVEDADPRAHAPRALLAASHELMTALFPAEDNHHLPPEALAAPGIHFFTARLGCTLVGTIALAERDGYGEVKALFVAETARGTGTARTLLAAVERRARARNLSCLRLETGDALHAARAFYRRAGYAECGPFGDYASGTTSIFMEKHLRP